jgi:cell division protein FtsB
MSLSQIPWPVVTFIIAQLGAFIWFLVKIYFKTEKNTSDITALALRVDAELDKIAKENAELKKELKEMRDILVKVENNTHLLMLGRIKTGAKDAA